MPTPATRTPSPWTAARARPTVSAARGLPSGWGWPAGRTGSVPGAATRLGQPLLTDPQLLRRIADALEPSPEDVVIEIGPGRGSLTVAVAPRVAHVIAIEKDARLARECGMRSAECGIDNVSLVEGDALKVEWHALLEPHGATP